MTTTKFGHVAVTGASSGIGAALAETHAANGILLSLAGRDEKRLASVADRCRRLGAEVATTVVDVRDHAAVAAWIAAADDRRPLDLVYANAGIGGTTAVAGEIGEDPAVAAALVATNLGGVVATAGAAIERFVPRGSGRVVLIGSLAGQVGLPHSPVYSATKAGVAVYADGLRRLVGPRGVGVTLVEPGFVRTPMSVGVPGSGVLPWSAKRAAEVVSRAAATGRPIVRFPWPLALALAGLRLLPRRLADAILVVVHRAGARR